MAKFLKWCCGCSVALALLAGIAVFLAWRWAKNKPTSWTAEASIEIAASPEEVLPLLEDLRRWSEWSKFERDGSEHVDREFGGAERGAGATVLWMEERSGSDTPPTLGKLEIDAASLQGLEYTSWHYGSLRLSMSDGGDSVGQSTNLEIGGFDEDFRVPGTIRLEPTERGCRVTWSESVDLGATPLARFYAITLVDAAHFLHEALLKQSLEGLKNLSELR